MEVLGGGLKFNGGGFEVNLESWIWARIEVQSSGLNFNPPQ